MLFADIGKRVAVSGLILTAAWLCGTSLAWSNECDVMREKLAPLEAKVAAARAKLRGEQNYLEDLKARESAQYAQATKTGSRDDFKAAEDLGFYRSMQRDKVYEAGKLLGEYEAEAAPLRTSVEVCDLLSDKPRKAESQPTTPKSTDTAKSTGPARPIPPEVLDRVGGLPPPTEPTDNTTPTDSVTPTTLTTPQFSDPNNTPNDPTNNVTPGRKPPHIGGGFGPVSKPSGGGELPKVWCVIYRDIPSMTPGPFREWAVALPKDIPWLGSVWTTVECNLTFPEAHKKRTELAGGPPGSTPVSIPPGMPGSGPPSGPLPPVAVGPLLPGPSGGPSPQLGSFPPPPQGGTTVPPEIGGLIDKLVGVTPDPPATPPKVARPRGPSKPLPAPGADMCDSVDGVIAEARKEIAELVVQIQVGRALSNQADDFASRNAINPATQNAVDEEWLGAIQRFQKVSAEIKTMQSLKERCGSPPPIVTDTPTDPNSLLPQDGLRGRPPGDITIALGGPLPPDVLPPIDVGTPPGPVTSTPPAGPACAPGLLDMQCPNFSYCIKPTSQVWKGCWIKGQQPPPTAGNCGPGTVRVTCTRFGQPASTANECYPSLAVGQQVAKNFQGMPGYKCLVDGKPVPSGTPAVAMPVPPHVSELPKPPKVTQRRRRPPPQHDGGSGYSEPEPDWEAIGSAIGTAIGEGMGGGGGGGGGHGGGGGGGGGHSGGHYRW